MSGLRIKNCGAKGEVPVPHFGGAGGAESFPLWVEAQTWTDNAWLIEDCEVSDFHSMHNGYCSAIMATTPAFADAGSPTNSTKRVVDVRRCMVRGQGAGIAFGTARSAGVSFHDNVVTGMRSGFNCDTFAAWNLPLRNVDFTNSILLDVDLLGHIGTPYWSANSLGNYSFTNFTVSGNAVRLRAVPLLQDYSSYKYQTVVLGSMSQWMPVTDPSLVVGRFYTGMCAGLQIACADRIWFQHNRFTTRPRSSFFEPNAASTNLALWRPLYRPATNFYTGVTYDQTSSSGIHANSNWLSGKNMDFASLAALATSPTGSLPATSDVAFPGFTAAGWVGRVRPLYDAGGRLQEVREVQVGQPVVISSNVFVPVYYTRHTSATGQGSGQPSAQVGLAVVAGPNAGTLIAPSICNTTNLLFYARNSSSGCDRIVVYADFGMSPFDPDQTPCWSVVEATVGTLPTIRFERTPDVANDRELYPGTLRISRSSGTGLLPVRVEPVINGVARAATPGVDYDLYTNSWAAPGYWYWRPPQADGSWLVHIQDGKSETTVRVRPRMGAAAKQQVIEREAAFFRVAPTNSTSVAGPPSRWTTTGAADSVAVGLWDGPKYTLQALSGMYFGYPSGSPTLQEVEADPAIEDQAVGDEVMDEENQEWMQLAPETGLEEKPEAVGAPDVVATRTGTLLSLTEEDYAPWPASTAFSTEYPEDLTEEEEVIAAPMADSLGDMAALSGTAYDYTNTTGSAAYAINNATNPVIGGYGVYSSPIGPLGGWWVSPSYTQLNPTSGPGMGTNCLWGVDDAAKGVGIIANRPMVISTATSAVTYLPTPNPNGTNGVAQAISPNGQNIVGWTDDPTVGARVKKWTQTGGQWNATNLGAFYDYSPAVAFSVNDAGTVVGESTLSGGARRGFRTTGAPLNLATHQLLFSTASQNPPLTNTWANVVDASTNAVGAADFSIPRGTTNLVGESRPAIWWWGTDAANILGPPGKYGTPEWVSPDKNYVSGFGEALGINAVSGERQVVGTSFVTRLGNPRAWVTTVSGTPSDPSYGKIYNLNDAHLTYAGSWPSWILLTAEAVNTNGWIVGTATGNGTTQGYVLVPQASE